MDIEWDASKADRNQAKHSVDFEEAVTCLLDPNALAKEDLSTEGERRWILVGMSSAARLLTVVYTLREEEQIRIISARKSTRKEAQHYA